jgi:hypothetical protein
MKANIRGCTLTTEMVMKGCRLCHYTKSDGKFCCAPAMRRRTYCYFHLESVRREKRMARRKLRARVASNPAVLKSAVRAIEIKDLVSKVFNMKILRDIARLNPELGRFYEKWGEGVADSTAYRKLVPLLSFSAAREIGSDGAAPSGAPRCMTRAEIRRLIAI